MKIGYVIHSLSGIGPRTRARTLIDAFGEQTDCEILVITSKEERYSNDAVTVHRELELTPYSLIRSFGRTRAYLVDVDVVHVPVNLLQVAFTRSVYSGPLVAGAGIQHELPFRVFARRLGIDKMIETHEYIAYLWEKSGIDSTHVYPAVNTGTFFEYDEERIVAIKRNLGISTDERIVLYVGKLNEFKGAHLFDRAVRDDDFPSDVVPVVVGDGELRWRFEGRDDLVYKGFVDNVDLPSYYNAADVTVVPSENESFSLVSLESAACGTPVVTTSSADSDMARLFMDRDTYVWTDERSADALVFKIRQLLTDETVYRHQVDRGYEAIRDMGLTIDDSVERHMEIYEEVRTR